VFGDSSYWMTGALTLNAMHSGFLLTALEKTGAYAPPSSYVSYLDRPHIRMTVAEMPPLHYMTPQANTPTVASL